MSKEEERGSKGEDSSKPYACPRIMRIFGFSSNRASKIYDMSINKDKEVSSFLEKNRNEVEAEIHEVECKSLQDDYMGEEREDECTPNFFVGDLQINPKYVGSSEDGETYWHRRDRPQPSQPTPLGSGGSYT